VPIEPEHLVFDLASQTVGIDWRLFGIATTRAAPWHLGKAFASGAAKPLIKGSGARQQEVNIIDCTPGAAATNWDRFAKIRRCGNCCLTHAVPGRFRKSLTQPNPRMMSTCLTRASG
jgi:hypothetical protein